MKNFIHNDFLLQTDQARELYHDHAARLPIVDFHGHLPPEDVALDRRWDNLTQAWLCDDHYKWRAMRANGVAEAFCTGDASDREKFDRFAATLPYLLRNPMHHWCHLELARYFDINELLCPETADAIWERTAERLSDGLSARSILAQSHVKVICTTDDPVDDLKHHQAVRDDAGITMQMLPTWRPDQCLAIENPREFNGYVDKLAEITDQEIRDFDSYLSAIAARHDYFHSMGCRVSDHGIEPRFSHDYSDQEIKALFEKTRSGKTLDEDQANKFRTAMMMEFNRMDFEKGWAKQLHLGAFRDCNEQQFKKLGPNTGFDAISDRGYIPDLARYFNMLSARGILPKTIVYNLNPNDTETLAVLLGSFQDGSMPGKLQLGSAWWFLDQMKGITDQLEALSAHGLLRRFVGMVTDSRSFLSMSRHEYFRRILCNLLGIDMAEGRLPNDASLINAMVREICHENAKSYFDFEGEPPPSS